MQSLVSTEWLADELGASGLLVLDASAHLPSAGRDAAAEFAKAHIPGARFLALKALTNPDDPVPSAPPTRPQFDAHMSDLGVTADKRIVLCDDSDLRSAARAWFLLRLFGLTDIAILDGGLAKWIAEGRPIESGTSEPGATTFESIDGEGTIRMKSDMLANIDSKAEQVVDARGASRFTGEEGDFRSGVASGHIPGSRNLPFGAVLNADGTFKDAAGIRAAFAEAGVDLDKPITTTCGSGITASVLLFALHLIGVDAALYDGSWSDWGSDPKMPVETGPAR
ncbi:sulfurtransferase [Aurantiacibacter sediminis]|uniref:Sulfurtransferase n=1 Tax=Aurantiacibacter sediminis TaxID=2793064 RepID=A0ABS0N667_9SPHN|nr:sulfurtransferase [Aurantiacibacter sediminis]MBH5323255.1 sulfurtransferase [Aurantiacibacter sediminis]